MSRYSHSSHDSKRSRHHSPPPSDRHNRDGEDGERDYDPMIDSRQREDSHSKRRHEYSRDDRGRGSRDDDYRNGEREQDSTRDYDRRRKESRRDDKRRGREYDDRRRSDYDEKRRGDNEEKRRGEREYEEKKRGEREYDDRRGGDKEDDRRMTRGRSRSPQDVGKQEDRSRSGSPIHLSKKAKRRAERVLKEQLAAAQQAALEREKGGQNRVLTEEERMMKEMGFPIAFDTTQGKQVEDNTDTYIETSKVGSKRKYRQYMNRKGGFNRVLDEIY